MVKDVIKEFQSRTDKKLKYAMTKVGKPKLNPPKKSLWQQLKERVEILWDIWRHRI